MNRRTDKTILAVAILGTLMAGPAWADLTIGSGLLPSATTIHFSSATGQPTITGTTQQTGVEMTFFPTPTVLLDQQSGNGQSQISAASGSLTNLTAQFSAGYGTTGFDFSVSKLLANGSVTITAYDQDGDSFVASLGAKKGADNKYHVTASTGELITKVEWSVTASEAQSSTMAKQYRILAIESFHSPQEPGPLAVPEPSMLMFGALAVLVGIGYGWLRRPVAKSTA